MSDNHELKLICNICFFRTLVSLCMNLVHEGEGSPPLSAQATLANMTIQSLYLLSVFKLQLLKALEQLCTIKSLLRLTVAHSIYFWDCGFYLRHKANSLAPPYFLSVSSVRQSKIPEKTIRNDHERVLLYPYTSNSFKLLQTPLNLPSWELSPAQICLTRCLFYFLNWALPSSFSHPSLNPLIHPLIHFLDLCV